MKKLLFVAALGIACLASANEVSQSEKNTVNYENTVVSVENLEWCGTVNYQTSCGFVIQDSYCSSWGLQCLQDTADLLDEYFCAP